MILRGAFVRQKEPPMPTATLHSIAGRERTCAQCGTLYRAPRATSRFCGDVCRKRNHRGSPTADAKATSLVYRWLLRRGYAGQIGPVNSRDPRRSVYGLTVHRHLALAEWNSWNPGASMTDEAFKDCLRDLGLIGYHEEPVRKQANRR